MQRTSVSRKEKTTGFRKKILQHKEESVKRIIFIVELIVVIVLELYKLYREYKRDRKARAGMNSKRF